MVYFKVWSVRYRFTTYKVYADNTVKLKILRMNLRFHEISSKPVIVSEFPLLCYILLNRLISLKRMAETICYLRTSLIFALVYQCCSLLDVLGLD